METKKSTVGNYDNGFHKQPNTVVKVTQETSETNVFEDESKADDYVRKMTAREKIRKLKDFEDDLVDQKVLLQFMIYLVLDMYNALPQDQKDAMQFKERIEAFMPLVFDETTKVRADLESDKDAKLLQILQDEVAFSAIVNDEYLSKKV
jgi:hypothetical protein